MTAAPYTPKNSNNGNESRSAADKVSSAATDVQGDLASLQQDILKLSTKIGDLAAAKGTEAWNQARRRIDDVLEEANAKGRDAADAAFEVRDSVLATLDEAIETRPYTTLAVALAAGFIAGAMWKR